MFIFYLWCFFRGNSNCRKKNNPRFFRLKGNPLIPNSNCWSPTVLKLLRQLLLNMAIEIVDFPIKMVNLSIVMLVYQRVTFQKWFSGWDWRFFSSRIGWIRPWTIHRKMVCFDPSGALFFGSEHWHVQWKITVASHIGGLEHFLFFHILGISWSQLTNSYFSEGQDNHQPAVASHIFWLRPSFLNDLCSRTLPQEAERKAEQQLNASTIKLQAIWATFYWANHTVSGNFSSLKYCSI